MLKMENLKSKQRASILFSPSDTGMVDEDQIINDVTTTSIEKIIKILKKIKNLLMFYKADKDVLNELDWVTVEVQGKSLYDFDNMTQNLQLLSQNNKDFKNFLDLLQTYSMHDGGNTPTNSEIQRNAQQRHSEVYQIQRSSVLKKIEARINERNMTTKSPAFFFKKKQRTIISEYQTQDETKMKIMKRRNEEKEGKIIIFNIFRQIFINFH